MNLETVYHTYTNYQIYYRCCGKVFTRLGVFHQHRIGDHPDEIIKNRCVFCAEHIERSPPDYKHRIDCFNNITLYGRGFFGTLKGVSRNPTRTNELLYNRFNSFLLKYQDGDLTSMHFKYK